MERTYYLFPFSHIEKGEEVIIWGYGHVGVNYVEQILETGYCKLLMVLDKSWDKKQSSVVLIKSPEEVKNYKSQNIKIVIAHQSMNVAEQIRMQLMDWGIEEKNIVYAPHKCYQGIKGNSLESDMYHIQKVLLSMESYIQSGRYISNKERKHFQAIHDSLHLKRVKDKSYVRIGGGNDGSYVMLDDFMTSKGIAYSFGIGDDVSWDLHMAELGYDIYMYDHTIPTLPKKNENFHFFKLGIADSNEKTREDLKSLEYFLELNQHNKEKDMILKMDVEGAEWGFLINVEQNTLLKFDQIVLELHRLLNVENTDKIVNALKKLSETHQLVHLHGNNSLQVKNINGCLFVEAVEALFVRKDKYEFVEVEKNELLDIDEPNRRERIEVDWSCVKI